MGMGLVDKPVVCSDYQEPDSRTIRNPKLGLSGTETGLKPAEMLGSSIP
jgi:hypothetical protein